MVDAARMALPWPEAGVIDSPTLEAQIAATARELPRGPSYSAGAVARTSARCASSLVVTGGSEWCGSTRTAT